MKKFILIFSFILFACSANAQLEKPIKWLYNAQRVSKNEAVLYFKAKLKANWHVYAQKVKSIPMKMKFTFTTSKDFSLIGQTTEPEPIKKYDNSLKMELAYFEKEVVFRQKIKLNKSSTIVKVRVEFMVCNARSCLPAEEISFSIPVK